MITIDGLLAEPHARAALSRLGEHARVVCFDRRGVGLPDPLDPARSPLDDWTQDLSQVLDAMGIGSAHLFANFDTGLIALEFAARHPERVTSLVLAHSFAIYHRTADYPHGLELDTVPGTDSLWFTHTPELIDRTIAFLRSHSLQRMSSR